MGLKTNWVGVAAGLVAFASLFFPWFTIELWTQNLSSTMSFIASLYQLTATVEGVTKSIFLIVWFNASAFVLMLTAGVICLLGSRSSGKKGMILFVASIVLAAASMVIFAYGLVNSDFAVESLNPGYAISKFPDGSFRMSAEEYMQYSYRYSWAIGIGFWLALLTVILALMSAFFSRKLNARVDA